MIEIDAFQMNYSKLIDYLFRNSKKFQFIIRPDVELSSYGKDLIKRLKPFELEIKRVTAWPGTELIEGVADLYVYSAFEESQKVILEFSKRLTDWSLPMLPEDLCFLRQDASPILTSISHEKDFFLTLSKNEKAEIDGIFYVG